ncbi:MAG: zinc transporter ZntB [Sphingopyxis sp.]|nr:zinc transporter ZntB [Sphingopyxis sp.]
MTDTAPMRILAYDGQTGVVVDHRAMPPSRSDASAALVWVHVDRAVDGPLPDLADVPFALPTAVQRSLIATESRPRCDMVGDGILLNIRVPAHPDKPSHPSAADDALVSLRIWAQQGQLVSVSLRPAIILPGVEEAFLNGRVRDAGDLLITLALAAAESLDPEVAAIGDALDALECAIDSKSAFSMRREVTRLRSASVEYRRFILPQRIAIERLAQMPLDWINEGERVSLREASDRFARMAEELESIRERAAVLHDELADLRAEKLDTRSLQIAIATTIFMPLTFITGLLGMNVKGIPYAEQEWAFNGVMLVCLLIATGIASWFAWRGWSRGG